MDVPESIPEQEPLNENTEFFSDRASRVQGEGQSDKKTEKPQSQKPLSKGTIDHPVISMQPAPPENKIMQENDNPEPQQVKGKKGLQEFPDGTVIVAQKKEENPGLKQQEAKRPMDFLGAAKNVSEYIEKEKFNNPDSNLGGVGLSFDANFSEFGWYAKIIKRRIGSNWFLSLRSIITRELGRTYVVFTIHRSGEVTGLQVSRPSGSDLLDMAALNAIKASSPLPPLPEDFPDPLVNLRCAFEVYDKPRRR